MYLAVGAMGRYLRVAASATSEPRCLLYSLQVDKSSRIEFGTAAHALLLW